MSKPASHRSRSRAPEYSVREWRSHFLALPTGEFFLLLAHVLHARKESLLAHPERIVPRTQAGTFLRLARRRLRHEPIAHLTKTKEFFGLKFLVSRATLIPRPETELLVTEALRVVKDTEFSGTIVDIGTGGGCIIIALAKSLPTPQQISFAASDISVQALRIARKNARQHVAGRPIRFFRSDLLSALPKTILSRDLIITANLPYLSRTTFASAPADVREFEPLSALTDAKDGLSLYRRLFRELVRARQTYRRPITVLAEFSPEQRTSIVSAARKYFPTTHVVVRQDLAGKARLLILSAR